MIEHVGALEDHRLAIHLDGVEADLDRFLDELLRHLLYAVTEQLGRARERGVAVPRGQHRGVQTLQRIIHERTITSCRANRASKNRERRLYAESSVAKSS